MAVSNSAGVGGFAKPILADDDVAPQPLHLGLRTGVNVLLHYLQQLQ